MTDLVERLRARSARSQGGMDRLDTEAADEIEMLRAVVLYGGEKMAEAEAEIERLRAENDRLNSLTAGKP